MSAWIRGNDRFRHNASNHASALWEEIETAVCRLKGSKPFDAAEPKTYAEFKYLPSQSRTSRFEIVDGHSRYQAEPMSVESTYGPVSAVLGPVEVDILSFAASPNPTLAVLIGGMGSGKSTTIKYLKAHYLSGYVIILCNLDANLHMSVSGSANMAESEIAEVLVRYLTTELNELIAPEKEYKDLWTWGLSNEGASNHPSKYILSAAQEALRDELGNDWRCESDNSIRIRRQCRSDLRQNPFNDLTYQALRIDYYLSCCCDDDRSRFLLVFDNVDPLPPHVQFRVLDLASRLQTSARCKVLLPLRPLTYSSNLQAAHRTVEVIEHIGPSVVDLINHRVRNTILNTDMPKLAVRVREDGHGERVIEQEEAKRWVSGVMDTLRRGRRQGTALGDPDAHTFINGLCGHSLRAALLVAPKLFGSTSIPVLGPLDGDPSRYHRQRVRDHDVIRAILDGWESHFAANPGRVTDNLFDLGTTAPSRSCTCKVRLLKRLAASNNGIVTLGEVRMHLSRFGYDDQVILDAINGVIAQTKRLAWSDSVAQYPALDGFQSTKLQISYAGWFYISYAMFNLVYVQEVHVDILLPREETLEHDPRNFADRVRSLELFIRYLYHQDRNEVKRVLLNNASADYNTVYNASLFSIEMIMALTRQIKNIGGSMLTGKLSSEKREEIRRSVER